MSLPDYTAMADALLALIVLQGGPEYAITSQDAYRPLADYFGLSERQRTRTRPDGRSGTEWENRVQWTRQKLINAGLLDGSVRGVWRLTGKGARAAKKVSAKYTVFRRERG